MKRILVLLCLPVAIVGCAKAPSRRATGAAPPTDVHATSGARLLEVHAHLTVEVGGPGDVDPLLARAIAFTSREGGFVEQRAARSLVLRVPVAALDRLRTEVATKEGVQVLDETRTTKDVTDAVADLDARLRNAHRAEERLLALLDKQTGSLADVLAVEKSLGETRERIERMEAEQRLAKGRVELATVEIGVQVAFAEGNRSFGQELSHAAKEGVLLARDTVRGVILVALRLLPLALLVAPLVFVGVRIARRRRA